MATRGEKRYLICDCERTMALDGAAIGKACGLSGPLRVHTHLCRTGIEDFKSAAGQGGTLVVACTQEEPLFRELLDEMAADAPAVYTNIRERAGWSEEGGGATAKIAALLAEAAVEIPPAPSVTLSSEGTCLVYGVDEKAIEAARQLAPRLDVTVMIAGNGEIIPPSAIIVPLLRGTITGAAGHLGAFEIDVDGYAQYKVSARGTLAFEAPQNGVRSTCDLIVDLTGGAPLFSGHDKRDGYFRPDPGNPAEVQRALFDAADLVGEFEKPRYVAYDANLCAHARSGITGCSRCIDACPAAAIAPEGNGVAIDPYICGGCGMCNSVCPTGAVSTAMPPATALLERAHVLLDTYASAGGRQPVLLVHDERHGERMVHLSARFGAGLPANVIPFVVREVTQLGLDFLLGALAYGAARIVILVPPERSDDTAGLERQAAIAAAIMTGLSYDGLRIRIARIDDPDALEHELRQLTAVESTPAGQFLPMGAKRGVMRLALAHLHAAAPAPVDVLPLPPDAPFGAVEIDAPGCTLCHSCVGACPTRALQDDPDTPVLRFQEDACVQCGLCRSTCPENVITLMPRLNFIEDARRAVVLKEDEPFHCVRCGEPFGTKSSIEHIIAMLADKHPMFRDDDAGRLRMCENCRVIDQMEAGEAPFGMGPPRRPRTTDDYLREREERAAARARRDGDGSGDDG